MNSDRVQLNLRLDRYPEMYKLIKARARAQGSSMNDFCINLLREGLNLDTDKAPIGEAFDRISNIEERLERLESALLGESVA